MTALMGTFVKLQTMADGTPRIVLEMQCGLTEIAALNLVPGAPFALARLKPGAQPEQEPEKPKGGALAKLAAMWCNEPTFWQFLSKQVGYRVESAETAAMLIRGECKVGSRAELDSNEAAAMRFQEKFRLPYMAHMQGRAA